MEPMAKTNISLSGGTAQEGAAVQRRSRSSHKPLDQRYGGCFCPAVMPSAGYGGLLWQIRFLYAAGKDCQAVSGFR